MRKTGVRGYIWGEERRDRRGWLRFYHKKSWHCDEWGKSKIYLRDRIIFTAVSWPGNRNHRNQREKYDVCNALYCFEGMQRQTGVTAWKYWTALSWLFRGSDRRYDYCLWDVLPSACTYECVTAHCNLFKPLWGASWLLWNGRKIFWGKEPYCGVSEERRLFLCGRKCTADRYKGAKDSASSAQRCALWIETCRRA